MKFVRDCDFAISTAAVTLIILAYLNSMVLLIFFALRLFSSGCVSSLLAVV